MTAVVDLRREKKEIEKDLHQVWDTIEQNDAQMDTIRAEVEAGQKRRDDLVTNEKSQNRKDLEKLNERKTELHLQSIDLLQRVSRTRVAIHKIDFQLLEKSRQYNYIIQADADQQAAIQRHQNDISAAEEELKSVRKKQEDNEKQLKEKNNIALDLKKKMDSIIAEMNDSADKEEDLKRNQIKLLESTIPLDQKLADLYYKLILAEGVEKVEHYRNKLDNKSLK